MHRTTNLHRYNEADSETDYSSDNTSGESKRLVYLYPRKKRLIKVVPDETVVGNRDGFPRKRRIIIRKQPNRDRIIYPSPKYRREDSDTDSDEFSSDDSSSNSRAKIVLLKNPRVKNYTETFPDVIRVRKPVPEILERRIVRKEVNNETVVPARKLYLLKRVSENRQNYMNKGKPSSIGEHRPVHKRLVHVQPQKRYVTKGEPSHFIRSVTTSSGRSRSIQKPTLILVKRPLYPSSSDQTNSSSNSSTSTSTSSVSYDSDSSSSSNGSSLGERNNKSNQTGRLLIDYSKMLKSQEERKKYEQERKKYEHEKHIVTLVQKEVNKRPPLENKPSVVTPVQSKSPSLDGQSCVCETVQKEPKPLPSNSKPKEHLNEKEEIKRKIQIEKERRKKAEQRNKLEAWVESESKDLDQDDFNQNETVYNFDECRNCIPSVTDEKKDEPDNLEVKVNYDDDFEQLYPESRYKGCQLVYYIDLTKPQEIQDPKPFDIFPRQIVPQPKKKIDGPVVKVGGGWNTMDYYLERHIPVKKFEYKREHAQNLDLPEVKKKYYGFRSHYDSPRKNRIYRQL